MSAIPDAKTISYDLVRQAVEKAMSDNSVSDNSVADDTEFAAAPALSGVWSALKKTTDIANYQPQARADVIVEVVKTGQGEFHILKDRKKGLYLQLSPEDHYLWTQMDGSHTVIDLVVEYCMRYKALAQARIINLVQALLAQGLLVEQPYSVYSNISQRLARRGLMYWSDKVLTFLTMRQIAVKGIDGGVGWLYRHGIKFFYIRPLIILMAIIALVGGIGYASLALSGRFTVLGNNESVVGGVATFLVLQLIGVFLHEGGHAFTVKHYGREVWRAGILIYLGLIGAFVDTTDMWLESKWPRIAVTAAGPFVNLVLGGAASLFILAQPDAAINGLLYQFALGQYLLVSFNLSPFLKLDGYYILTDLLGIKLLRERALAYLSTGLTYRFSEAWKKGRLLPTFKGEERLLVVYGVISALWTANLLLIVILLAPVQFASIIGSIFSGENVGQVILPLIVAVSLLFGFVPRIYGILSSNYRRLSRFTRTQPAWQATLALAAVSVLAVGLPLYVSSRSPGLAALYARVFPLVGSAGGAWLAFGQWRAYRSSSWRRLFTGLALTSILFTAFDLAEWLGYKVGIDSVTLDNLALLHALSLIPAIVGIALVLRLFLLSLSAELKWAWVLLLVAGLCLILSALTPAPMLAPLLGDSLGQYLFIAGLFLHGHLTRRPIPWRKAPDPRPEIIAGDFQVQGKFALKWLAEQIVRQAVTAVGQEKLLPLAYEFNRNSAAHMWRVWVTMEGEVGSNPKGDAATIETNWRAALNDLLNRVAAIAGMELTRSALYDAFADLPRPAQPAGLTLLNGTSWTAGLESLLSADGDRVYLERAFRSLGEYLVAVCARVYGWRIEEEVIANFNRQSAAHGWEVWLRAQGRFDSRPGSDDQNLVARTLRYRQALSGLLANLTPTLGQLPVETALIRAHDNLPWMQREVADNLLLNDLDWLRHGNQAKTRSEEARIVLLRGVDFLAAEDRNNLAALTRHLRSTSVKAGRQVVRQGQIANHLYIIVQGKAQIVQQDEAGVLRVQANLSEGDVFGAEMVIEQNPLPAALVAVTDVEIYSLDRVSLLPFLSQHGQNKSPVNWLLLRHVALFREMPLDQLEPVVEALKPNRVEPGQALIEQGAAVSGLYIVQSGQFEVLIASGSETPQRVATLGAGEVFGEQSLVTGNRASATVKCTAPADVLFLEVDDFQRLVRANQAAMQHLEQTGSRRRLTTREPLTLAQIQEQ